MCFAQTWSMKMKEQHKKLPISDVPKLSDSHFVAALAALSQCWKLLHCFLCQPWKKSRYDTNSSLVLIKLAPGRNAVGFCLSSLTVSTYCCYFLILSQPKKTGRCWVTEQQDPLTNMPLPNLTSQRSSCEVSSLLDGGFCFAAGPFSSHCPHEHVFL